MIDDNATLTVGSETSGADTGNGGGDADLFVESTGSAAETTTEQTEQVETTTEQTEKTEEHVEKVEPVEEPELKDYRSTASARIRGMMKLAPKLAEVFKEAPQLQSMIEGIIRRETAMREIFPTVAEARAMREQFPSGQADVKTLLEDVKEVEEIDRNFDEPGQDGTYPGHVKLIDNFFQRDRQAAISLLKTMPKEWARLDRESYNDVMGKVIGATLQNRGIPEYLEELAEAAKTAEQPQLEAGLRKLLAWVNGYTAEKPRPTQEEERLANDRKAFERTRNETQKTEQGRFHSQFVASARTLQLNVVNSHKAVQRLQAVKSLSDDRKKEIVEKIRTAGEQFLSKSPSFMRKLREHYNARNSSELTNWQKAAWSQPWFLNMIVRQVFNKEIPSMVQNNREAALRRTGAPQRTATPAQKKPGDATQAKGPRQVAGRWYKTDGTPFTTAEIVAGKHLQT